MDPADDLAIAYPSVAPLVRALQRVRRTAQAAPLDPFFEPVALLCQTDQETKLASLDPATLVSWMRHVSCYTRVRMFALEDAALGELSRKHFLPAMVLIRAYLESAASASLADKTLRESTAAGNHDPLLLLIPKMLLGSAMRNLSRTDEAIADFLTWGEHRTITAAAAVKALGHFLEPELASRFQRHYALLCEYSHPNSRGATGFRKVTEEHPEGWTIQYLQEEDFDERSVRLALELIGSSAAVGYATAEILRVTDVVRTDQGFELSGPKEEKLRWVWEEIIQPLSLAAQEGASEVSA